MTEVSVEAPTAADVAVNLAAVKGRVRAAAEGAGRPSQAVTIVAVTKAFGSERILPALEAGHRVFGENRVQEARAKWPALKEAYGGVELHLVGPLQTNKVRPALALFDVIETVDRENLAAALAAEMARSGRRVPCYVQVNTGEEPQKAGVLPADADALIETGRSRYELPIVGVMCLPPIDEEPSLHFALLAQIARRHGLAALSMGMTADYEVAIGFGATHVRLGTAIFGPRPA